MSTPARPVLPYGRQSIDDADVAAVTAVLRGDWLTQGPTVVAFEDAFARRLGARHAIAVNSGTAALHAAIHVQDLGPGDEVIVPVLTFAASANCVAYAGATPVLADVDPATLTIDPADVARRITPRTRAIVAVDYAGLPADYPALERAVAGRPITVIADACHSLGAALGGVPSGRLAALTAFSFHPVKHVATGEGGMLVTDDDRLAAAARRFRSHGIERDERAFVAPIPGPLGERGPWSYEMQALGYNYRLSDIHAALGLSQLGRLDHFLARRREIAAAYDRAFARAGSRLRPAQQVGPDALHAFHLYPIRVDFSRLGRSRAETMARLRARGVGTQVHYIPVHLMPYYRARAPEAIGPGRFPHAEAAYLELLSLPMYPAMTDDDVARVIDAVTSEVA